MTTGDAHKGFHARFEITQPGVLSRAVDRETGAPVLVRQCGGAVGWHRDVEAAACARALVREPVAGLRRVVFVGDAVVFEDTPGPSHDGPMPLRDAAECALQACEIAASLVARGYAHLSFTEHGLDVGYLDGRPAVRFTVPPPEARLRPPFGQRFWARIDWASFGRRASAPPEMILAASVCCLFFELAPDAYVGARRRDATGDGPAGLRARFERWIGSRDEKSTTPSEPLARLSRYCHDANGERAEAVDPSTVYTLDAVAKWLAEVIDTPEARARVEALSRLAPTRLVYDWDAIAADGESRLSRDDRWSDRYIALPLAEAHHQRASALWARGDFEAALTAVNRALALDRIEPYLVTRSVVLAALGRVGEARFAIDAAFDAIEARRRRDEADTSRGYSAVESVPDHDPDDAERARTHAARGAVALRERRPDAALADLETATRMDPTNAQHRWLLAQCLVRLGRRDEAIVRAKESLTRDPSEARRARYARLFGEAPTP